MPATAADWLTLSGLSYHFQKRQHWRQVNPGAGFERDMADQGYGPWAVSAGYLRNSYDKHSIYAGVRWTPLSAGPFRFGLYGLAASGYPSPVLLLPVVTLEGRGVGANLIAVPNLPGYSGYLGLQLRFALPERVRPGRGVQSRAMYPLIRPCCSPSIRRAATVTIAALHLAGRILPAARPDDSHPVKVMGIDFPNRVGLAAGLDKNGEAIDGLARLGFGFIEIGTVTPSAARQPRPRMFRLPEVKGIINRMGFNNHGVDALIANVRAAKYKGVLGINIGKNFDTPIERAVDDYLSCLDKVYAFASYVAVNISSPNTKDLRQLQGDSELDALLGRSRRASRRSPKSTAAMSRWRSRSHPTSRPSRCARLPTPCAVTTSTR